MFLIEQTRMNNYQQINIEQIFRTVCMKNVKFDTELCAFIFSERFFFKNFH